MRTPPERAVLMCLAGVVSALPAAAEPRYSFDLPSGPRAGGVARIARRAHVTIVAADPTLLAGSTPRLEIVGTVDTALSRLLAGTSARAERLGAAVWRIVARRVSKTGPRPRPVVDTPIVADIIVVGSKHDVPLSVYPASIEMIKGDDLLQYGSVPDASAIMRLAPAVQSTHLGPGRDKLFLRGIADSSFNGSGAALVGLYVNDVRLTYNAPDPNLRFYDTERVEILEGPQGTLYGAGSLAGLIRVTTRAPDVNARSGEVWFGGTAVAHGAPGGDVGGIVNIPLSGEAALRAVGYGAHDGGYVDDAARSRHDVNGSDTLGGRATLRVGLGGRWSIDAGGLFQDIRNHDAQYTERGLPPLTRSTTEAQPSGNLVRAAFVTISGVVGSVDVSATSGIVGQRLRQSFITDEGTLNGLYRQRDTIRLLTEEIRLSSRSGAMRGWTAGISLLDSATRQVRSIEQERMENSLGSADARLTEVALFGEVTTPLTGQLSLTAGGRLTAVRLAGVASGARGKSDDADKVPLGSEPPFSRVRHERFAVPSLAMGWAPAKPWLLFARYSQGFRPGGQTASGIIQRFDADRIDSVEAGLRFRPAKAASVSGQLSATYSLWRHIQADVLSSDGLPVTSNIGDGVVRSITGSVLWKPAQGFEARLAGTLAGGRVTGYDVALDRVIRSSLPNIAGDTLAASLTYGHAINDHRRATLGVSVNHVGHSVLGSDSMLATFEQGGYWSAAAGVDFSLGACTVSLHVDNLLDSSADVFAFGTPSLDGDAREMTPLRPRTLRLGLRRRL